MWKKGFFLGKMLMQNAVFLFFLLHFWLTFFFFFFFATLWTNFPWTKFQVSKRAKNFKKKKKRKRRKMRWKANFRTNARDLLGQTCFFIWPKKWGSYETSYSTEPSELFSNIQSWLCSVDNWWNRRFAVYSWRIKNLENWQYHIFHLFLL